MKASISLLVAAPIVLAGAAATSAQAAASTVAMSNLDSPRGSPGAGGGRYLAEAGTTQIAGP
jgi:hypothetical protein